MTRIVTKPFIPIMGYSHVLEVGTVLKTWCQTAIGGYLVDLPSGVSVGISRTQYEERTEAVK